MAQDTTEQTLVLDMHNLQELTMAGIRALLDARYHVDSLLLIAVPEHIKNVMAWANITDFFTIYPDLDQALKANKPT